jgi:hypothetical protein
VTDEVELDRHPRARAVVEWLDPGVDQGTDRAVDALHLPAARRIERGHLHRHLLLALPEASGGDDAGAALQRTLRRCRDNVLLPVGEVTGIDRVGEDLFG